MSPIADDAFAEARRRRARAEFAEWDLVLTHREREIARIDATDDVLLSKELARRAVTLEIAQRLRIPENSVWRIIVQGEEVRDRTPAVWVAFRDGVLDARRVGLIADMVAKLHTPKALEAVDQNAAEYGSGHTPGELRAWLKRLRARLEPEKLNDDAAHATEQRHVEISHNDDGTSWLSALLPTGVAVAVGNRLRAAAKALPKTDPDTGERDRRTREQKKADLLAHWLTCSEGTQTDIRAEIAITIDSTDLIGLTHGAAFTRGHREPIPAAWARELAASEHTLFRRLGLDPFGNVMDTTKLGYHPSESLREALRWRDGTCRVAGCQADIRDTDLDHELAYDRGGTTSADNLRSLCRKHHNMKSHDHLDRRSLRPPVQFVECYAVGTPVVYRPVPA
ncbi:HNH endonuclease [Aeromicrobium flavum]|nr:HNH endonuclease signature motif containing protein [Aeromicrobium flavum]